MGGRRPFRVKDNGRGIAEEDKRKVFEFFEGENMPIPFPVKGWGCRTLRRCWNGTEVRYGSSPKKALEQRFTSPWAKLLCPFRANKNKGLVVIIGFLT